MRALVAGFTFAALIAIGLNSSKVQAGEDKDKVKAEFYTTHVKPIFDANCARCHGGMNHRGGLNMDTRENLLKGGHDGPVIAPGNPKKSMLVMLIRHEGPNDDPKPMPPKGDKLSDADIKLVEDWIKDGAIMPAPAPAK